MGVNPEILTILEVTTIHPSTLGLTLRLRAFLLALLLFLTLLAFTVILFLYFLPYAGKNGLQDDGVFIDLGRNTQGSSGVRPKVGAARPSQPNPATALARAAHVGQRDISTILS